MMKRRWVRRFQRLDIGYGYSFYGLSKRFERIGYWVRRGMVFGKWDLSSKDMND